MRNYLILLLVFNYIHLFSQDEFVEVIYYEDEMYFLYPEKQKIGFNPATLIWKNEVEVSKTELRKYKWHRRRFFKRKSIVTKFPTDGKWIQLYDIEKLQPAKLFEVKNGLPNGEFKRFNEFGQLLELGNYLNGNRNGVFHYYPDSTNSWRNEYATGGYIMGDSMYYELAFLPYYHVIDVGKHGKWETRDVKGNLSQLNYYSEGQLNGQQTVYYSNGNKASEENFAKGLKNGIQRYWYENGQLKEESNFLDNMREAPFFSWYDNGLSKCDLIYNQDSIIDGECKLYYPSGKIFGNGILADGVRVEDWTFWYEGGTKLAEGKYRGYKMDICISGMARPYLHSVKVGKWAYWYENSNLLASGDYQANRTRISRGDIYESLIIEDSWLCNDRAGNEIPCTEVKKLMNLELKE